MLRNAERDLEILTAVGEGVPFTQRALAERLGVALGLTNLYLKRLVGKGYIKVTEFPTKPYAGKRLRYVLTPRGITEKARLTYEYVGYSLRLYRRTRGNLREAMAEVTGSGMKRFALYGVGEGEGSEEHTPELQSLTNLVCRPLLDNKNFLGLPVRPLAEQNAAASDKRA